MLSIVLVAFLLPFEITALNFDWERDQLTESVARTNSAVHFGTANAKAVEGCRFIPGDDEWPSNEDWSAFNDTLSGALLRPKPLGSVCYAGPDYDAQRCAQLRQSWTNSKLQYISVYISIRACCLYVSPEC